MADRVTEDEISILLRRTRSTRTGEEHETIAFKPLPGETVAELAQRVLTTPSLTLDRDADPRRERHYQQTMEVRLIVDPDVTLFPY